MLLPAWSAVKPQVPLPLVIVTVFPEIEQAPLAARATVSPEVELAVMPKVLLYAAEAGAPAKVMV